MRSLKASQRAGLARNRKILNAERTLAVSCSPPLSCCCPHLSRHRALMVCWRGTGAQSSCGEGAAAKELLSFLGAVSDDIEAKTEVSLQNPEPHILLTAASQHLLLATCVLTVPCAKGRKHPPQGVR
eukprot:905631-Rhodomonas_salina.1